MATAAPDTFTLPLQPLEAGPILFDAYHPLFFFFFLASLLARKRLVNKLRRDEEREAEANYSSNEADTARTFGVPIKQRAH